MKRIKFSQHNKTDNITCQNNNLKQTLVRYIYHKNQKDKPCEKDLPLLKNDIPNNLGSQKPVIYSRYRKLEHRVHLWWEGVYEPNDYFFLRIFNVLPICEVFQIS